MSNVKQTDQGAARRLDFICGVVLAVLSLVALVWVIPAAVPGEASRGEVAPSFFPKLTAGIIFICSLALAVLNRDALRANARIGGWTILGEIAGWGVLATTIMLLLIHVGLVPASILATAVATVVARYRGHWGIPVVVAIALPFVLRFGVQALFSIELP